MTLFFDSDGVSIAYADEGPRAGPAVLLVHGFASNKDVNWRFPGWIETLTQAGYRTLAIDNRGHGESEKLRDPAAYRSPTMAADAARLLDHAGVERAAVMGYSMGARIAAFLALAHPERVSRAVFGGLGMGLVDGVGAPGPIVDALEAPALADVSDATGRAFRAFAEQTKSDLPALAACMRSARQALTREEVAGIAAPVLVAVGEADAIAGAPEPLAALLPRGDMTAVGDKAFKAAVLDFLERTA
jgi:pimeloyl-ACP methyl ester carboxylesterase